MPDSSPHQEHFISGKKVTVDPEVVRAASLVVCAYAAGIEEARELLSMLGLAPTGVWKQNEIDRMRAVARERMTALAPLGHSEQ